MSNFLSHTVTLLVIKHTITPEHCTNIVPLSDKLYEAGQSCVRVFVMRPLRPIRVLWPWRVYWETDGGVMPTRPRSRTAADGSDAAGRSLHMYTTSV